MKIPSMSYAIALATLLALGLSAGCATTKTVGQPANETLVMDPMLIRGSVQDGEVKTEVVEASDVLKKGTKAFVRRRYDEAIAHYKVIIDEFPGTESHIPALYNSGLAYERLGRHRDAAAMYQTIIEITPTTTEATDSLYRLAECNAKLAQWSEVVRITAQILDREELTLYDRIEAHVRQADGHFELGNLNEAEKAYRQAININNRADPDDTVPTKSHFVAGANFGISRIYHRLFADVRLALPLERMEKNLEDKAQLFMQAQTSYIRTMRLGNPHWSTASGYNIGRMYEDFYAQILAAEIPDDLTKEERDLYFEELRKKIKPLMERAMQIYEKNIIMSERFGVDNDFTRETQQSLERLKTYIVSDELQTADEKKILEGKTPERVGQENDGAQPTTPRKEEKGIEPVKPKSNHKIVPLVDDQYLGGA